MVVAGVIRGVPSSFVERGEVPSAAASDPPPTGRLFHSQGASGPAADNSLPALDVPRPVHLRSADTSRSDRRRARPERNAHESPAMDSGLSAGQVLVLVIGVTVLIAFTNAITTGDIAWPTGIALILISGYAAATVRPRDGFWALVSPPLAFFVATVTAGQLTVTGSGGFLVKQGLLIPFTLGQNVLWIVGATLLAGALVWLRRRRALLG